MSLASRDLAPPLPQALALGPTQSRTVLALAVCAAAVAGALAAGPDAARAAQAAGPELGRLLRAMAALKLLIATPLVLAVAWRLGVSTGPARLVGYAAGCAAMAAGPGLIWSLAHVPLGALLLHGGLLGTGLMLWRDPMVGSRLAAVVAARRAALATGAAVRTAPPPSARR